MSKELFWLGLVLLQTVLFTYPYVLNRMAVRGLMGTMKNPDASDRPLAEWASRAQRAHANAVENLVVFAPAVLAVQVLGRGDGMTATACAIYFFARLVHYVSYAAGIPVVRTLAYFAGVFATLALILRILGVV